MSREIKFRAWYDGEMLQDAVVVEKCLYWENGRNFTVLGLFSDICVELMQFTGLKDKNGKEIYEGDILQNAHNNKAIIKFDTNVASFNFVLDGSACAFGLGLARLNTNWEVIGNIYENPELLGESK